MPSFASEIKRQLASGTGKGKRRDDRAELAGLLDSAGLRDSGGVTFRTLSAAVARSVVRLWRREFEVYSTLSPAESDRFGRQLYSVRGEGGKVLRAAGELEEAAKTFDSAGRTAYLRGAFQGCGSVARPGARGGHHLEFVHPDGRFVRRVASCSRAPLKVFQRRERWVAYTKSADGVMTVLAQMGLHDAVLQYEARAVLAEAKANANRTTNFDSANAARTAKAAAKQQKVLERLDPANLPPALARMREIRLENPDASLADLARISNLSKSAVNHRLRRLVALAEDAC